MEIKKPNFIIIGSAKCGTSTLATTLYHHPDCCFSQPKEVEFFNNDNNYSKGWEWYQQAFAHYNGEPVIGEATPSYSNRLSHPETAQRIYQFNPDMKLVYIVRDPYQKYISVWRMLARGKDPIAVRGIDYFFENHPRSEAIQKTCCYFYQLEAYKAFFPDSAILILFMEELSHNAEQLYNRLFRFLGLEQSKINMDYQLRENTSEIYVSHNYWKRLQQSKMRPLAKKVLPASLIQFAFKVFGGKRLYVPKEELNLKNRQIFNRIVTDDALAFLEMCGKPSDYWEFLSKPKES